MNIKLNKEATIVVGALKGKKGKVISYDKDLLAVDLELDEDTQVRINAECINQEEEEVKVEVEPRTEGGCPYCGHDCADEYIQIQDRKVNDLSIETQRCTKCGKDFDNIYNLVFVQSQGYTPTEEYINGTGVKAKSNKLVTDETKREREVELGIRCVLVVQKYEDESEFELEEDSYVSISTTDGCCMAAQLVEVCDGYIEVIDEDGDDQRVYFDDIADIEQN